VSFNPVTRIRAEAFEKAAPRLAELADRARTLGKRMLSDVLELGDILAEGRSLIAHGHWLEWLKGLGLSEDMARRFIDVWELSKSRNLRGLESQIPLSAIYILARPGTPEESRAAVFARLDAGEKLSLSAVTREVAPVSVRIVSRTERIATPAAAYGKDSATRICRAVEEPDQENLSADDGRTVPDAVLDSVDFRDLTMDGAMRSRL
jgi:hypothetical protein